MVYQPGLPVKYCLLPYPSTYEEIRRAFTAIPDKIIVMKESMPDYQTPSLQTRDCGTAPYLAMLHEQRRLHQQRIQNHIPDTILLLEHPPVITLGVRKDANQLLVDRADLNDQDIEVIETHRGGGVTAHNPGQLVCYPIIHLQDRKLSVIGYMRSLEAVGMALLAQLGVRAQRRQGYPGLWINDKKKIASVGVRISRYVTYHGMAINIQNDLRLFDMIVPCGLEGIEITSVYRETGNRFNMQNIKQRLHELLMDAFSGVS
jgi:lipoyl(octanoyl) transferase